MFSNGKLFKIVKQNADPRERAFRDLAEGNFFTHDTGLHCVFMKKDHQSKSGSNYDSIEMGCGESRYTDHGSTCYLLSLEAHVSIES